VQEYRRGRPREEVAQAGAARGSGTVITFTPDVKIFGHELAFDPERILEELEVRSFLHRGLRLVFRDQTQRVTHELKHDRGILDYVEALARDEDATPVIASPLHLARDTVTGRFELALCWPTGVHERVRSFVNGIPTEDGGTHEQGLRDGFVKAMRNFIDTHSLQPRGVTITSDDLREGLYAILSLFHTDPQFQGQTKDRLNNPEVRPSIDGAIRPILEQWLHDNKSTGETLVARAVQAARARIASRQAASAVRRKSATSKRLNLPGKLADCSNTNPAESELFIVEGDSAGGSAKQGRNRRSQAILPLRGKVLNAEQNSLKKVLSNEELGNIVTALGCGLGKDLRPDRIRYQRIVLLMDADSDGHHITTLLLTFFLRYLRPLIERGHVYIAQPPLYKVVVGKDTWWARDDRDRDRILSRLPARARPEITRFKGLGEMPPKTLFSTTLDPKRRTLLQVTLPDYLAADTMVAELMGKDAQARYALLMERADEVDVLDV